MVCLLVFHFLPTSTPPDLDKKKFKRRFWATDGNGSEYFAYPDGDLSEIFKLIVSISEKMLNNRNTVVRRQVK